MALKISKHEKEMKEHIESYASKAGLKINPDKKQVDTIVKGLLHNKEKHGKAYCPCRVVTGDEKKDKDIVCPCVFHRGEIELRGQCLCQLFFGEKKFD